MQFLLNVFLGELRLSGNHTLTEYEMSETIQSKERMDNSFKWANFPGNDLYLGNHSVVLPVMANIAQWLGAHYSSGSRGGSLPLPAIKYPKKMK